MSSLSALTTQAMPKLGEAFLSGSYLHLDYDKQEFTLWEAPEDQAGDTEDLVPVGPQCDRKASSASSAPSSADASSSDEPVRSDQKSTLSGGAIAGVVIGVLAALALIALGLFLFWRRRKRARLAVAATAANSAETAQHGAEKWGQQMDGYQGPAEMGGWEPAQLRGAEGQHRVFEMEDAPGPVELDGRGKLRGGGWG